MGLLPQDNTIKITSNKSMTNKTYKMHIEKEQVNGYISDDLEAVKQAVYKVLNTERYKHIIYSTNYGVELEDLFGKPIPYVLPEIPRRIEEALLQDERITSVEDFKLDYTKDGDVTCEFTVHSIYGNFKNKKVVKVNNV